MRVRALAAGVVVSAVLLTGCEASGDEPAGLDDPAPAASESAASPPDPTGDPAADPTTTTPAADEEWSIEVGSEPPEGPGDLAVYEAYLAYWRADLEALSIPDPAHQPFLDLTIDPQRQRVVAGLERRLADGVRTIGTLRLEPLVMSVSGPTAAIQDCLDARDTYDVDPTGAEVGERGSLAPVLVQLFLAGDQWVVADIQDAQHDCG